MDANKTKQLIAKVKVVVIALFFLYINQKNKIILSFSHRFQQSKALRMQLIAR